MTTIELYVVAGFVAALAVATLVYINVDFSTNKK